MHVPIKIKELIHSQAIWTTRINNYQKVIDEWMKENNIDPYPKSFANCQVNNVDECNQLATEIIQYLERS